MSKYEYWEIRSWRDSIREWRRDRICAGKMFWSTVRRPKSDQSCDNTSIPVCCMFSARWTVILSLPSWLQCLRMFCIYIKYGRWQMGREAGECWLIMLDCVCLWFWTLTQCKWDMCKCNLMASTNCWGLEKAAAKIKLKVKPTCLLLLFFCHVSCHSIGRRAGWSGQKKKDEERKKHINHKACMPRTREGRFFFFCSLLYQSSFAFSFS